MSWLIESYLNEADTYNIDTAELNRKIQEYRHSIETEEKSAKEWIEKYNNQYEEKVAKNPENKSIYAKERDNNISNVKQGLELFKSKTEKDIRDLESIIRSREPKHKVEK